MADDDRLSLGQLIQSFRKKRGKIPYEIGAFVLLEGCEQVLGKPSKITLDTILIRGDGSVLVEHGESVTVDTATRSVCETLATVLVGAGPGVPPVLVDLVEHGPSTGDWQLTRLRDELEAALLPLNRSAARRVLSRMIREALGEFQRTRPREEEPPIDALDSELDGLLGDLGMEVPDNPPPRPPSLQSPAASVETAGPAGPAGSPPINLGADGLSLSATAGLAGEGSTKEGAVPIDPESLRPSPTAGRSRDLNDDLDAFEAAANRRSGGGPIWAVLFLLMAVGSAAAFVALRPDLVRRALGQEELDEPEETTVEPAAPEVETQGNLRVDVSEDAAEVYLYVGRGPVEVEGPGGVPREFLALAEGRAPTRAIVPVGATWEFREGAHWVDLAVQLPESSLRRGRPQGLGESLFPAAYRAAQEAKERGTEHPAAPVRGSVRVITNPSGAKVYELVGFSPGVEIKNVQVDEAAEILVWKDGYEISRAPVLPSDWETGERGMQAEVTVTLDEL